VVANEDDVVFSAYLMIGESTLKGGQDGCHILLFFKGTMFEPYQKTFLNVFACYGLSKPKNN
jgi:hypothetical protein